MKINLFSGHENTLVNGIFSGYYSFPVTGFRKKLYSFSSPSNPVSSFTPPYDAKLQTIVSGNVVTVAVGKQVKRGCNVTTDRSGVLYFYDNVNLVGACHGYGSDEGTYYSGHNFYNAFYPAGYFTPPYGENISIFQANKDGSSNLQNKSCNNFNYTEYNDMFGIPSMGASDIALTTNTLTPNILAPIVPPQEACPPLVTVTNYFDELNYKHIAGTTVALGAGDPYNGNPIPTALDSQDIKVNGRYSLEPIEDSDDRNIVVEAGRAKPSYTSANIQNKLNTNICPAVSMEGRVITLKGSNGLQLMDAPDIEHDDLGGQVNFVGGEQTHYWHWAFRENSNGFPFTNNFIPAQKNGFRRVSEGTQLFASVLSSEDMYWENRQCPAPVDYLPHTFGASIYACPSEHFDIPYYAALKKYGFYGTRFFNTCRALNLENEISGVEHASELDLDNLPIVPKGEIEPEDLDKDGEWSFKTYANLLKTAKAEEQYSNMYALNKGFFLWANKAHVLNDTSYQSIVNTNPKFGYVFTGMTRVFDNIFQSGLSSFTGNEPNVVLYNNIAETSFEVIDSGKYADALLTNDVYLRFKDDAYKFFTGQADRALWTVIEGKYSFAVLNSGGFIDEDFYRTIVSGREKRIRTRYFENVLRGNPIDLFPLNSISFSTDQAKDYIESTGWGYRSSAFGLNSILPQINRRYFEGAYGQASAISGLNEKIASLASGQLNYYYPGFFNDVRRGKEAPNPTYLKTNSGAILDSQNRAFSPSGWLAVGYNEIGALDGNFSCFTPLFVQQPLPKVFCKIGQRPTFRSLAVDYHTLPEDKINRKYPEVVFWASKLKLLDCNQRMLYPVKYKWYRVPKTGYNAMITSGYFSLAQPSHPTGEWACLEGDGPNCTLIHPSGCYPISSGQSTSEDDFTFLKGAKYGTDDSYYYFCLASGRFGVRISNPAELNIENWLAFDVAVRNGMNGAASVGVNFEVEDYNGDVQSIDMEPRNAESLSNYQGYKFDPYAIPETVIQQKVPPPNAGWGDVTAVRFAGPVGYIGETRTFAPSNVNDNRGLRETWGRLLDYGPLVQFYNTLSQQQGDALYGYKHLPTCEDYKMGDGKKGVKATFTLNGLKVAHWSLDQKAVASLDNKIGIKYDKLVNIGDLYPPITKRGESPNYGIGHWQFANNLGAIKRFGQDSTEEDLDVVGSSIDGSNKSKVLKHLKEKLLRSTNLGGTNCGYTKYGAGRNMLYYIEAFERFYILCDPVKKKNVTNRSFISPALRLGNSAIQYFWMGKPYNTYLSRKPMYGPYAYQWKVNRHNRDRNGNGISQGFYSMGFDDKYSLMYDAPATFGLYIRTKEVNSLFKSLVHDVNIGRRELFDRGIYIKDMKNIWFGEARGEGGARRYGDFMYACESTKPFYNEKICDYISKAQTLANNPNSRDYVCPELFLKKGACFDPCLSMRYAQGFFPGGKLQDMFGYNNEFRENAPEIHNIRLVPLAKRENDKPLSQDQQGVDNKETFFRSPLNTPHARIINNSSIGGVTPCQDGGSEHCNYITPTISLGTNTYLLGSVPDFNYVADSASNEM